jgi:hypothetical protein
VTKGGEQAGMSTGDEVSAKYHRGQHPHSRAALEKTKWQPGESGNASGRRGPIVNPHLERMLAELTVAEIRALDEDKLRGGEAIARKRILRALDENLGWRDTDAIQDRVDGPVKAPAHSDTYNVMALTRIVRAVGGEEREMRELTPAVDAGRQLD